MPLFAPLLMLDIFAMIRRDTPLHAVAAFDIFDAAYMPDAARLTLMLLAER